MASGSKLHPGVVKHRVCCLYNDSDKNGRAVTRVPSARFCEESVIRSTDLTTIVVGRAGTVAFAFEATLGILLTHRSDAETVERLQKQQDCRKSYRHVNWPSHAKGNYMAQDRLSSIPKSIRGTALLLNIRERTFYVN